MHTSMVLVPFGQPCPVVGDWVDLQRPLTMTTLADELRWTRIASRHRRTRHPTSGPTWSVRPMAGVVMMNYHGYLIIRGARRSTAVLVYDLFDPWTGPLVDPVRRHVRADGRGRRHADDAVVDRRPGPDARDALAARPARPAAVRRRPAVRLRSGPARSCRYYGAMFVLAAVLFTLADPLARRSSASSQRVIGVADPLVDVRTQRSTGTSTDG